ncbi:hypothetical protein ACHAXT_001717 [Thalassiosira profunda]
MEDHSAPYQQSTMRASFHREAAMNDDADRPTKKRTLPWCKILLGAILLSVLIFVIVDSFTARRIANGFQNFLDWIGENLVAGFFAFMGVYFVATVCFMPGMVLTVGGGVVFGGAAGLGPGVVLATTAVFVGGSAGAVVGFLLGRYLMREWVEQKLMPKYPVIKALDAAFQKRGFRIMLLMRLAPILPSYNIINYIAGVTSMSLWWYTLALVGILPGTLLYTYIGASAGSLASAETSGMWTGAIVVGVLFGIIAVIAVSYYAKKEFEKIVAEQEEQGRGGGEQFAPPQLSDGADKVKVEIV